MTNAQQSEVDKFFEGLPSEDKKLADVFEDKKEVKEEKKEEVKQEKSEKDNEGEVRENRQVRRLRDKLQRERESNIVLAERLKARTEIEEAKKSNPELDPRLVEIFDATDKNPVGQKLAKHFTEILSETKESAREQALRDIQEMQQAENEEVSNAEQEIDANLEAIEEAYNVDLTSDSPKAEKTRKEFLTLLEKLSPKDEDGTVTDYADFESTWEIYQNTHEEKIDNTRNKEIASRSMQRSGSANTQKSITPGFDGWKKDYGIE